jgi:hypothetical protein
MNKSALDIELLHDSSFQSFLKGPLSCKTQLISMAQTNIKTLGWDKFLNYILTSILISSLLNFSDLTNSLA